MPTRFKLKAPKASFRLENKGFHSRGAHRASPCKERVLRYTPAKSAFFTPEGIFPLTTPQVLEFSVLRQCSAHGKACYQLLKTEPIPDKIAKMHLTRLTILLYKSSKGHFNQSNAVLLKELASQSVGIKNDTMSLQIFQAISQIELFTFLKLNYLLSN